MDKKEISTLNKSIAFAGGTHNKRKALKSAIAFAEHDEQRLDKIKDKRCAEFRRRKEEWRGEPAEKDEIPHALPHERRAARTFRWSGWFAILLECILATLISIAMRWPWWAGVLIALVFAVVLHGGLLMVSRRSGRPRESYATLKRWVLIPSLFLAVISLLMLLAVRSVTGWLLLALLPFLTLSLWTATVGLLLLGAALLTAADIFDWSRKDAQEYAGYAHEQQQSINLKREWQEDLEELERSEQREVTSPQVAQQPVRNHASNGNAEASTVTRILPVLLGVSLLLSSACQTTAGGQDTALPQPSPTVGERSTAATSEYLLDLYMDASLSPNEDAYRYTIANIHGSLPSIIENWNVRRLAVFHFGDDGWNAVQQLRLDLPRLLLPEVANQDVGELGMFRNVEEAEQQRVTEERVATEAQARERYRVEVRNALARVTEGTLLPPSVSQGAIEPRCTSLFGVLNRIANDSTATRLVIVVTDGVESCQPSVRPIESPRGNVTLIIVLLPEKNSKGQENFERRSRQLATVCDWCTIVPHFTEDINSVLRDAVERRASPRAAANP